MFQKFIKQKTLWTYIFEIDGNAPSQNHAIGHRIIKKWWKTISLAYPTKKLNNWQSSVINALWNKNYEVTKRFIKKIKNIYSHWREYKNIMFWIEMYIVDKWINKSNSELKEKDVMNNEKYTSDGLFNWLNLYLHWLYWKKWKMLVKTKNELNNKLKQLKKQGLLLNDKNIIAVYNQKLNWEEQKTIVFVNIIDKVDFNAKLIKLYKSNKKEKK